MIYSDNEYLDENEELKKILMETCIKFSSLSKCAAKQVCCLLYKNGNIVSIGVNGSIPGTVNCCDKFKKINGVWHKRDYGVIGSPWCICKDQEEHHIWSSYNEVHGEVNAITKASGNVEGATAFVTYSPCKDCAKLLAISGIRKIYYVKEYDNFYNVFNFLKSKGINLEKMEV